MSQANTASRKQHLSHDQRVLLSLMQEIRFGRIERLLVRDGKPLLTGVRWKRTVKLGGDDAPHPCADSEDFALRREVADFFKALDELGDAELTDIEIRNGLPFTFAVCGATPE
jgi:hypothetical protein